MNVSIFGLDFVFFCDFGRIHFDCNISKAYFKISSIILLTSISISKNHVLKIRVYLFAEYLF